MWMKRETNLQGNVLLNNIPGDFPINVANATIYSNSATTYLSLNGQNSVRFKLSNIKEEKQERVTKNPHLGKFMKHSVAKIEIKSNSTV